MEIKLHEMTDESAIELFSSDWWVDKSPEDIVRVQLFTAQLCIPFALFQEAVEKALGRPVRTHEFASAGNLQREFLGESCSPSIEDIISVLPGEVLVVMTPYHGEHP